MKRESRYGFRGVKVGEASHPGPRTRARARMEAEAEAEAASGLEAAVTRIDDSDGEELSRPTWRDEASACEDMGRKSDVRNVWARVGDVEDHSAVDPTLLDSLAEDLVVPPHTNLGDIGRRGSDAVDDVSSEFCWGEMEDIGDDEVPECGVLPNPPSGQAEVSHHEGNCERPRARRLQLVSSQTVDVDVPHRSESGSLFVGGADVVHIGTPRVWSSSEVRRADHEDEAMGTQIDDPASDSSDTECGVGEQLQCATRWWRGGADASH